MTQAKGISLHIGVNKVDSNHYTDVNGNPWEGALYGCEPDADEMRIIAEAMGFGSINTLLTRDATRDAVKARVEEAADQLVSGDLFWITYSGHGGQIKDASGDEDDFLDETWCLYDAQLIDDELDCLWGKFAEGVRIFILSDSCHSGTVSKDLASQVEMMQKERNITYRFQPPTVGAGTYRKNRAFYDGITNALKKAEADQGGTKVVSNVLLISGCMDEQLSADTGFNGLFTMHLLRAWDKGNFNGDYRAFHEAIANAMPSGQQPNYYPTGREETNPVFEGQSPFSI